MSFYDGSKPLAWTCSAYPFFARNTAELWSTIVAFSCIAKVHFP